LEIGEDIFRNLGFGRKGVRQHLGATVARALKILLSNFARRSTSITGFP